MKANGDLDAAVTQPDLAERAMEGIRKLIGTRRLLPGEKIRQEVLAEQLGVSRSPLREALRTLQSVGIVTYEANRGYVVTRLSVDGLRQIYRMRDILEQEVLKTLRKPTKPELRDLRSANQQIASAISSRDIPAMAEANRAFHFGLFALSPLDLFQREIRRLWDSSDQYRATYLWMPETRTRIVGEHNDMLTALENGDLKRLVRLADAHRGASEEAVADWIATPD
jgi:DNA-binding GntR family transcriptional regulator